MELDHPGASPGALHCSPREARPWAPVILEEMEEYVYFKESSPQEKSRENGKWLVEVVFSIIFYLIQDDCTSMYNKMMHRSK